MKKAKPFDLIMFDWNGTLSSGLLAQEPIDSGKVTALFPGVIEVLRHLKYRGIKIGVATAASRFEMESEIFSQHLEALFDCIYTLNDGPTKPDPFALLEAMHQFSIAPEKTLMVGDTRRDMQMAKSAGVTGLGVSYGLHDQAELLAAGATQVVSNLSELAAFLDQFQ